MKNHSLLLGLFIFSTLLSALPSPEVPRVRGACDNPGFTSSLLSGTIGSGSDVETVDIDSDGDKDFVATDYYSDMQVYINDGNGTFSRTTVDMSLDTISSITAVDLDEDGDMDFVAGARTNGRIYWFRNNGGLSFTGTQIATLADVRDVVAINLNGAGGIDVAAVSYNGNSVYWYANDGSESFGAGSLIGSLGGAINIVSGDIDGDSDYDLVATGAVLTSGGTRLYQNNGSGSFTTTSLSTLNDGPPAIYDVVGDSNSHLDIAKLRGGFYLFTNNGAESFSSTYTNIGNYNSATSMSPVDLDADGDIDFILADYSNGYGWIENDGSENFSAHTIYDAGSLYNDVDYADFNGDGSVDLVGVLLSNNQAVLMMGTCDSPPTVSTLSPTDNSTGVAINSNLVITFNEAVNVGAGNIVIKKTSDNSTVETIPANSVAVTGTGTTTITINPTTNFTGETGYYIQIDNTAFTDSGANAFAGISNTTTWNFTTLDITAPAIPTSFSATPSGSTVALTWSNPVDADFHSITLRRSTVGYPASISDGTLVSENNSSTLYDDLLLADGTYYYSLFARDNTGNFSGASQASASVDTVAPTTTLSSDTASPTPTTSYLITITFSEVVTGFSQEDIVLSNGTLSTFANTSDSEQSRYTFYLAPTSAGPVTVNILDGVCTDEAGNNNDSATELSIIYAPTTSGGAGTWVTHTSHTSSSNSSSSTSTSSNSIEFTDTPNHWASEEIEELGEKCGVTGYLDETGEPTGIFGPDLPLTRAEMVKMLVGCKGLEIDEDASISFTDDEANQWYTPYLHVANESQWITGYPDGSFQALRPATREEAVKIIVQAIYGRVTPEEDSTTPFTDVKTKEWYSPYIIFAYQRGWITGYLQEDGSSLFGVGQAITRAEFAKILVKAFGW